jgi:hypothetical protein
MIAFQALLVQQMAFMLREFEVAVVKCGSRIQQAAV